MNIGWKSFGRGAGAERRVFSGPLVPGAVRFEAPLEAALHAHRAVWLSGQLEAPLWGSVQSYDGCGMSAGLLHNTAVLPGGPAGPTQGTLWKLLDTMRNHPAAASSAALGALLARIKDCGWEIARHGALVTTGTLKPVSAVAIMRELTPPSGDVPQDGAAWQRASGWASAFHEAFADPATRAAQIEYAATWLAADGRGEEHRVYALFAPSAVTFTELKAADLPAEVDLGMCIYHAFSVHNPGHARDALAGVLQRVDGSDARAFGKALVRALANRSPRWKTKRYPRTRLALKQPAARALWPATMIDAIAPSSP